MTLASSPVASDLTSPSDAIAPSPDPPLPLPRHRLACSSSGLQRLQIDAAIAPGADWLMLPMFRSLGVLEAFCAAVAGRVPVIPLVVTAEALALLPQVAQTPGVAEVYIGLNDLRLSLGLRAGPSGREALVG